MSADLDPWPGRPADPTRRAGAVTARRRGVIVRDLPRVARTVQLRAIVHEIAARRLLL